MYVAAQLDRRPKDAVIDDPGKGRMASTVNFPGAALSVADLSDLLEQVGKDRDRGAFRQVFQHFAPRIRTFLVQRRLSGAQADDLTQDVMLTIWRRAESYDRTKSSPSTWIYTIARNQHIDYFRKTARAQQLDENDPHFHLNDDPAPDALVSRAEDVSTVIEALSTLPDDQRLVVDLAFKEGRSHRDIADLLDLPLGTVKSRIRLAMDKMRVCIGELE